MINALEVDGLSITYKSGDHNVYAVRDISFQIGAGEAYGLIGESGSGKSSVALSIMNYVPTASLRGRIRVAGRDVLSMSSREIGAMRGAIVSMVYQNPGSSLNPSIKVGEQIAEVIRRHQKVPRAGAWERTVDLLERCQVGSPAEIAKRYPHQLSGGQQQRVMIAMALACKPALLVLDEPTTGLDVTTEARILELVAELRQEIDTAVLLITHNLRVVSKICDRVGVLYAGRLLEDGPVRKVLDKPAHPYTVGLLKSIPHASRQAPALRAMPGELPDLRIAHQGCIFRERCWMAQPICTTDEPAFSQVDSDHASRCHYRDQVVEPIGNVIPRRNRGRYGEALLTLTGISKAFGRAALIQLPWTRPRLQAVDNVSFTLRKGETLAIVGESGSGKSTLARCIVGLLAPSSGQVLFRRDVLNGSVQRRPRELVRQIQIVFQNPDTALNPQHTAGEIVRRPLTLYRLASRRESVALARALMTAVKLGGRYFGRYPPQLSGGEKQRVNIARAFAANPAIIVCDEVTSSLDISVQAAILNELRSLQDERQTSYIFISHDLGVVRYISDRVMVMFGGKIVEMGDTTDVYSPPHHPYTEVLLAAVADDESDGVPRPARLRMRLGGPDRPSGGCIFHGRCPRKVGPICELEVPPVQQLSSGHALACHIPAGELASQQADVLRVTRAPID